MTETPNEEQPPEKKPEAAPPPGKSARPARKPFDLEDRTYEFAQAVRTLVRKLPMTQTNKEDVPQLVRSSGSTAANYIEANGGLSRKDFVHRIKVCRKEAKESALWLRLIFTNFRADLDKERFALVDEARELVRIFNKIVESSE